MHRMARVLVIPAVALAALAVLVSAPGWLYLMVSRWSLPGPEVGDALPLDELSRRSAVPLVAFLGVWVAAAALLALLTRAVKADRLTASLLLALGTGLWLYLTTAVSLLIVRQVPAEDAFRTAGQLRAVYVPAALAGIAGALLSVNRLSRQPRTRFLFACFVAAAGLLEIIDGVLPQHAPGLLTRLAPAAHPVAHALAAPLGLALIVAARGLRTGRRRAWQLALALSLTSTVVHIVHSDYGAIPTGLLAMALLARRHDFTLPGDPTARPRVLFRALVAAGIIYCYGAVALAANRLDTDQPLSAGFVARETSRALVGLSLGSSRHLSGSLGHWFGLSVLLLGLAAAAWVVQAWLAPWRFRQHQQARERELARALIAVWGVDTLAPFVLRADKSYFFGDHDRAFLAYKVVGGVAIVSGDPIGPEDALDPLVAEFIALARERDWRIAILGASERRLELYRRHGLHALYHGDEAVIDTARFSLEGRAIRKVRQSVHRLQKAGYRAEARWAGEIDPDLRAELEAVALTWRGGEPERGFVMGLDALFRLDGEDALFVLGRRPDGCPAGFLHFAVCRAGSALSLASMPRLRDTPNGFNEWLVCETVAWARANGFARVSLNFAPFAALLAPGAELSRLQELERRALLALKGRFQLDNLLLFNRKFLPGWERRFVVYERRRDLPRIGIAALAAEAYLPLSGRGRR